MSNTNIIESARSKQKSTSNGDALSVSTREETESRTIRHAERAIDFETFVILNDSNDMELQQGVMVLKMAAQWEHERLLAWIFWIVFGYARQKSLGTVVGSRTPVRIDEYHARLPDLLFVRRENAEIIQQKGIYGTPEFVLELVSPNDRPPDMIGREADYRLIGVPEIVFIDQQRRSVRILRNQGSGQYDDVTLLAGPLALETLPGFELQVDWLFADRLPDEMAILTGLLRRYAQTARNGMPGDVSPVPKRRHADPLHR